MNNKKIVNIQILRAYAILLVLIAHFSIILPPDLCEHYINHVLSYINPGTGVDLFFVISGYLMGVTFLKKTETNSTSVMESTFAFYRKRFLRLMPGAYFWALFTLAMGLIFRDPLWLDKHSLINNFFCSLAFVRNFSEYLKPSHLGYYWSLSIEMQFYLLLPIAWFGLKRKAFWLMVIGLYFIGFFWRPGGENCWVFFRYDGLLVGLLVWLVTQQDNWVKSIQTVIPQTPKMVFFATFICVSVIAILPVPFRMLSGFCSAIVSLNCGYLLLMAIYYKENSIYSKKLTAILCFIGEISYSLYLVHIPVWLVIKEIASSLSLNNISMSGYAGIALSSSILVGWLSFKYIEGIYTTSRYSTSTENPK